MHRGLVSEGDRFVTDENTLDALRRAQEHRDIGAVEFDVHMTRDSQLVIRHDNRIDAGLSCQGSTLEEIKAYTLPHGNKIPTLHEWLVQARAAPGAGNQGAEDTGARERDDTQMHRRNTCPRHG